MRGTAAAATNIRPAYCDMAAVCRLYKCL